MDRIIFENEIPFLRRDESLEEARTREIKACEESIRYLRNELKAGVRNQRKLLEWEKSSFISFTKEQETLILEQFETEPGNAQEWSEQDIVEQVRKIMRAHPQNIKRLPANYWKP